MGTQLRNRGLCGGMVSSSKAQAPAVHSGRGAKITSTRTIRRPAQELYERCHDLDILAQLFPEPVSLVRLSRQRFGVNRPQAPDHSFTIRILNDRPGELIAWRGEDHGAFPHAGTIRFAAAPDDEGTEVTVTIEYEPKGGKLGGAISRWTHTGPGPLLADALRRFRALVEAQ